MPVAGRRNSDPSVTGPGLLGLPGASCPCRRSAQRPHGPRHRDQCSPAARGACEGERAGLSTASPGKLSQITWQNDDFPAHLQFHNTAISCDMFCFITLSCATHRLLRRGGRGIAHDAKCFKFLLSGGKMY